MRAKLSVLRACFRVAKPGARIAYYTIFIPPDVDDAGYRRVVRFWPAAATRRRWPAEMLAAAGFVDVEETDVTAEYERTARAWLEGRRRRYDELTMALGKQALEDKIADGEGTLECLRDKLLRRSMLVGRRSD